MEDTVDVLVVGGGPAGTPGAMALARAGRKVLLVEDGPGLGGTCLFEGCIPSKIFRDVASRRFEAERMGEFGLSSPQSSPTVDWPAVQKRCHGILRHRSEGALTMARQIPDLEVVFGRAQLTGPRQAVVMQEGERREVSFEQAILAAGSVANRLEIPGAELPGVLTSHGLIGIGFIPDSMVLIGGGAVGVEMALIFHLLGSDTTILQAGPGIIPRADEKLTGRLTDILRRDGVRVETGVEVESIEVVQSGHRVHYRQQEETATVDAQTVVMAVGRHPNVDALGIENTDVRADYHGVKVNAQLETDEPGIFAAGDVLGHPMFAHWATAQSLSLAAHLLGKPARFPRPETNTAIIFSRPELGMAGLTESAAEAAGIDVAVAEYDYRGDARAQISDNAEGWLRIIYRRDDHRIVGAHALVEGAADVMGEAALAVQAGTPIEAMAEAIHPHPTLTEAFGIAARSARAGAPPDA